MFMLLVDTLRRRVAEESAATATETSLSASRGPLSALSKTAITVGIVFPAIDILAVGFRFYAERYRIANRGVALDDYTFIVSLLFVIASGAVLIFTAIHAGLGWPLASRQSKLVLFDKMCFTAQLLWVTATTLVRSSLMFFYHRLFRIPWFRRLNLILISINFAWFIAYLLLMFIRLRWTPESFADKIYPPWLLSQAIFEVLIDVIMLSMPIPVIKTLNIDRKRKILISVVFALGIFCTIAPIVRLKYQVTLLKTVDIPSYVASADTVWTWSVIESAVSLLTACVPTYPAAFKEGRPLGKALHKVTGFFGRPQKEQFDHRIDPMMSGISKTVQWSVTHVSRDANDRSFRHYNFDYSSSSG